MFSRLTAYLRKIGPGFITGAADDDPSGIATYSQAGAQFGTSMLWVALFSFPLMAAVQEISARIGRVTGRGLAANIKQHCPRAVLYILLMLLAVSNTINVGADIGMMAASLELIVGRDRWHLFPLLSGVVSVVALTLLSYSTYSSLLKWLGLCVFSYVGTVFFVQIPWAEVGRNTLIPHLSWNGEFMYMMSAVLGTTISPYLFVWQSSLEVEEQRASGQESPILLAPRQARQQFSHIRVDTYSGMAVSNVVMYFIILTAAMTLHPHHITHIDSAEQAAKALLPIAGRQAFVLFSLGVIGTGLLAIPSLAASVGYAAGEAFGWPTGLDYKPYRARRFYAVIAISTLIGTGFNYFGINTIRALIWSAVINGFVSIPLLGLLLLIGRNHDAMGSFVIPRTLFVAGALTTVVMIVAAVFSIMHLFAPNR